MVSWPIDGGTAKFDLTLILNEGPHGLSGTLEYNSDLFDAATIRRMADHLRMLLESIVGDVTQPVAALPLLTPAERQQVLVEWNRTKMPTPIDRCAHQLFEAQAARQPLAIAATFRGADAEGQAMTYGELDQRANQLAHYLRELGVGPEVLVGILAERSLEMVVGILGIMKAGGAYLPLDPTYPPERLAFMVRDARVPVLLTLSRLAQDIPGLVESTPQDAELSQSAGAPQYSRPPHSMHIVCLDADWPLIARHGAGAKSTQPPSTAVTPDNLAYVIYTSGSTGRPKGTMLCHRGLSNLAEVQRQALNVQSVQPCAAVLVSEFRCFGMGDFYGPGQWRDPVPGAPGSVGLGHGSGTYAAGGEDHPCHLATLGLEGPTCLHVPWALCRISRPSGALALTGRPPSS